MRGCRADDYKVAQTFYKVEARGGSRGVRSAHWPPRGVQTVSVDGTDGHGEGGGEVSALAVSVGCERRGWGNLFQHLRGLGSNPSSALDSPRDPKPVI